VDSRTAGRRLTDRGVSSVQFLLASALALLLFLVFANLVVVQYGRGAIRSALEQGARVGAVSRSAAECEAKAVEVIGQLLGGRMSDGLMVTCGVEAGRVVASASAVFESWTVFTPDFEISMTTEAFLEPER
jgi:hypothetical protein